MFIYFGFLRYFSVREIPVFSASFSEKNFLPPFLLPCHHCCKSVVLIREDLFLVSLFCYIHLNIFCCQFTVPDY